MLLSTGTRENLTQAKPRWNPLAVHSSTSLVGTLTVKLGIFIERSSLRSPSVSAAGELSLAQICETTAVRSEMSSLNTAVKPSFARTCQVSEEARVLLTSAELLQRGRFSFRNLS